MRVDAAVLLVRQGLDFQERPNRSLVVAERLIQHALVDQKNPPILFFSLGVAAIGFLGLLQNIVGALESIFQAVPHRGRASRD